jgi:hypothetical protein
MGKWRYKKKSKMYPYRRRDKVGKCMPDNKVKKEVDNKNNNVNIPEHRTDDMTKEEGIKQVYNGGRHIVILGAGASIASSLRNPEKNEKKLPSMNNFIKIVGLQDIVDKVPDNLKATNFEELYSNLHNDDPNSEFIKEIEKRVFNYFNSMRLPDEPTIYDYLVLSLRTKDAIATFNWDPFLHQAWCRCRKYTTDLPHIFFLHGNVSIGWDSIGKRYGTAGMFNPENRQEFVASKLLYPISHKNYQQDEFIKTQWTCLQEYLSPKQRAFRSTIFGFGAPVTDVEAVTLLNDAWGTGNDRVMEQFEIIDISPEDELRDKWDKFIYGTHYDIEESYFNSSLAWNPRRTIEAYFSAYQPITPSEMFRESNPIPQDLKTLDELWEWHKPLIEAEAAKQK